MDLRLLDAMESHRGPGNKLCAKRPNQTIVSGQLLLEEPSLLDGDGIYLAVFENLGAGHHREELVPGCNDVWRDVYHPKLEAPPEDMIEELVDVGRCESVINEGAKVERRANCNLRRLVCISLVSDCRVQLIVKVLVHRIDDPQIGQAKELVDVGVTNRIEQPLQPRVDALTSAFDLTWCDVYLLEALVDCIDDIQVTRPLALKDVRKVHQASHCRHRPANNPTDRTVSARRKLA
mmetsp:Transcript_87996/g.244235  ORF Transcript_87996/g.244235 Transcript_87996/m.244235 type:complete len:235 (-) Transcript_87996:166-870(-)